MFAFLRSGLVLALAVAVAFGITALPSRAAGESKALLERIDNLETKVKKLKAKLKYVHVVKDPINGVAGPHVIFEGCNVHVRSGSGDSTDGTVDLVSRAIIPGVSPRGLGNLIIGYNETPQIADSGRGGSHNVIVGAGHSYPSVAGALLGQENSATAPFSNVTSGFNNQASGYASAVSGGSSNKATGEDASVSGGDSNTASGASSSVSGGSFNTASNTVSSVSGGVINAATGTFSSVSGGYFHVASDTNDWRAGALFQDN